MINSGVLRVTGQYICVDVYFLDCIRTNVGPIIEIVRHTQRAGLLDASTEGIVLEGRRANTGIHNLSQAVLEVPCVALAGGVGEGIAVCVMPQMLLL